MLQYYQDEGMQPYKLNVSKNIGQGITKASLLAMYGKPIREGEPNPKPLYAQIQLSMTDQRTGETRGQIISLAQNTAEVLHKHQIEASLWRPQKSSYAYA